MEKKNDSPLAEKNESLSTESRTFGFSHHHIDVLRRRLDKASALQIILDLDS